MFNKYVITSGLSTFTKAPMTPSAVKRIYSYGFDLFKVFKKGYKKIGICAFKNGWRVSGCAATHWKRARTLQALFDFVILNFGGANKWYVFIISWSKVATVPVEYQIYKAKSLKDSLLWDNSSKAFSLVDSSLICSTHFIICFTSSSLSF